MADTISSLVEQTRQHLYTGRNEVRNKLSAGVDASTETIPVTYSVGNIQAGTRISVDLEDLYVWDASGTTVTAQRGQYGSTAATHSSGAVVTVNPRFSDFEIFRALQKELDDLSSPTNGLFRALTVDLTWNPATSGYDLTGVTNVLDIIEVRYDLGHASEWPRSDQWEYGQNLPTSEFASGKALFLFDAMPGRTARVTYKAPFGSFTALSQDITTQTGLPSTAADILPLGAAIRLAAGREIRRNFGESQGDTRRAEEVPPGANLNSPALLRQLRRDRISAEAQRLNQQYPARHRRNWVLS